MTKCSISTDEVLWVSMLLAFSKCLIVVIIPQITCSLRNKIGLYIFLSSSKKKMSSWPFYLWCSVNIFPLVWGQRYCGECFCCIQEDKKIGQIRVTWVVFMERNAIGSQNIVLIMYNVASFLWHFLQSLMLDGVFVTFNHVANFRLLREMEPDKLYEVRLLPKWIYIKDMTIYIHWQFFTFYKISSNGC